MSKVRVLVGTRKGAFVLTSDEQRKNWEVDGPHFGGLPCQSISGGSQSYLCRSGLGVVWSGYSSIGRWRQELGESRELI